jgi:hypothetical protein
LHLKLNQEEFLKKNKKKLRLNLLFKVKIKNQKKAFSNEIYAWDRSNKVFIKLEFNVHLNNLRKKIYYLILFTIIYTN